MQHLDDVDHRADLFALGITMFEMLACDEFTSLPVDEEWALGIALLAEVCAALGDTDRAGQLYALLAPRTGQNVFGAPEASLARSIATSASSPRLWVAGRRQRGTTGSR